MLSRLSHHLPLWRRALRRRRRLLAALAAAALAAALLPSVLPPSARGTEVVVADAALTAGTVLGPEHLRTVRVAEELVPGGASPDGAALNGRTTRVDIDPGTPLLPGLLTDPDGPAIPEGTALMAVPLPGVLVAHLRPGTEIALLSTDPSLPAGTAIPARVIEVVPAEGAAGALGGPAATAEALVAVERARSGEVAHALATGSLMVAVIGS